MRYAKHFKTGQKLLLRPLAADEDRFEALSAFYQDQVGENLAVFTLPYGTAQDERYPFAEKMPFEMYSDSLGLGIRVTGTFDTYLDGSDFRVTLNDDFQLFQRRLHGRKETAIGIKYTKGKGTLRSFRNQWEKNVTLLEKSPDPAKIPVFPMTPINLSQGGARCDLREPVEISDLCLLLLRLSESELPICALAEVVWRGGEVEGGRRTCGMQFLNILERDRKRIETYLKNLPVDEDPPPTEEE
ncbi:MAG: hypothetical protein C0621_10870 [Desulfuromonas sp.]|nr:MAG: hypothetical protein C0621_10870 [Desulfuromonas sp.]